MFREAAINRRCLIPACHFFEWRHYKPEGHKKSISYPYRIELINKDYFYFAGIWQQWTDKETGETMDTFAIITTKANELMEKVHNTKKRMSTILTENLAWEWIMCDIREDRIREIASFQHPFEKMSTLTTDRNFKTSNNPLKGFEYAELPTL